MLIYYLLILIIVFTGFTLEYKFANEAGDQNQKRRYFLVASSLLIWFITAFRSVTVGADTTRYIEIYNDHLYGTGWHVFKATNEWGFTIFQNFLSMFVSDRIYLIIVAGIIMISFGLFFWKHSQNLLLSIILHITIGLFAFTMSGIRQSLAICITFLAFKFAREKKPVLFIASVFIAFLFHNSALCFLPVYFVVKIREIKKNLSIFILAAIAVLGLFSDQIIFFIKLIAPTRFSGLFSNSYGINSKSFILYFGILLLCMFVSIYENDSITGDQTNYFLLTCVIAVIYAVAPNVFLLDRLALYFIPYGILLISNSITNLKHLPTRYFAMLVTIAFGIMWFSVSIPGESIMIDNYTFMWQ